MYQVHVSKMQRGTRGVPSPMGSGGHRPAQHKRGEHSRHAWQRRAVEAVAAAALKSVREMGAVKGVDFGNASCEIRGSLSADPSAVKVACYFTGDKPAIVLTGVLYPDDPKRDARNAKRRAARAAAKAGRLAVMYGKAAAS